MADITVIEDFVPFHEGCTIGVNGCTGVGKTHFIHSLLGHLPYFFPTNPPARVLYAYGIYQPRYVTMENQFPFITFHNGFPTSDYIADFISTSPGSHNVLVIDDLMEIVLKNPEALLLFVQKAHHMNLTTIYVSQNLFAQSRNARTIALNTHYLVLFKNFRDGKQIRHLGQQIFPHKPHILSDAYTDATSKRYGYILIDMSPHSHNSTRLRTDIFPKDTCICYPVK